MTNSCSCHNCQVDSNRTPQKKIGLMINELIASGFTEEELDELFVNAKKLYNLSILKPKLS